MTIVVSSLLAAAIAVAPGQCERVEIACSHQNQLMVIGSPDLLSGERAIELPPGVGFQRSVFVREALTFNTVAGDDPGGAFCRPDAGHLIAIERVRADRQAYCVEPWSFSTILERDGDRFVLPQDDGDCVRETFVAASLCDTPSRACFRLIDLSGRFSPSVLFTLQFRPIDHDLPVGPPKEYVCPMRCEGEKLYPAPGMCAVCGMQLQDRLSHMDHSPRHGGTFFMAPDGVHHLEGALIGREFRLYSYDEYTRPIDAAAASAAGFARAPGDSTEWPLEPVRCETGEYLAAQIDPAVAFPIRVKIRVTYAGAHEPSVFDFDFDQPPTNVSMIDSDAAGAVSSHRIQ